MNMVASYLAPDGWRKQDAAENAILGQVLGLFNFRSFGQGGSHIRTVVTVNLDEFGLPAMETSARNITLEKARPSSSVVHSSAQDFVRELRALTGFTWGRLGDLLNVSPRMIHLWQNGEAISEKKHAHLAEVVAVMKYIDRGDSISNRELLLSASPDGVPWFNALSGGEYARIREVFGSGIERARPCPSLSRHALRLTGPDDFGASMREDAEEVRFEADLTMRQSGKRLAKPKSRRR